MSRHLAERIAYHNATLPEIEMFWASALRVIESAGYVIVDREDAERISATWGPSLDEASPADLTIYDRLRDALAERDDDAI